MREVDVGEANGRVFLNNSSIGLYPAAVADREKPARSETGTGKWLAMGAGGAGHAAPVPGGAA